MEKESYNYDLREGFLTCKYVNDLKRILEKYFIIEEIPNSILKKHSFTKKLTRLPLFVAKGNKSWQGLVVGFPGNTENLRTSNVGTPYLRSILYPILSLFHEVNKDLKNNVKCIYFLGSRFSDVFLRKFNLLSLLTPHIIILTNDLVKTIRDYKISKIKPQKNNLESLYQQKLCESMNKRNGLKVPIEDGSMNIGYISHEVQTGEGTRNPERLDILGYNIDDHSLVAFEIKGPSCGKIEFENLLFQGLEHRNWLENNKMAVKLIKEGPRGNKINTKKRIRLILGFCNEKVPSLFHTLKRSIESKDKYIKIDFVNILLKNDNVELSKLYNS